ncbi:MAG: hypothetical protein HYV36_04075 [Lentisphaerae bacterium]|nr:hypothetical protein [Lentisphaerota bacterium]
MTLEGTIAVTAINKPKRNERQTHRPRKPWRLIFNWDDGSFFDLPWWDTDPGRFRRGVIRPLLAIGADAVALSLFTTDEVLQDSDYANYAGQHERTYDHVAFWERDERTKRMIATRRFQLNAMVEEGHRAGLDILASFRMNDCHDTYYSPEHPLWGVPPVKFKLDHPELLIPDGGWSRFCLDYALPAVRDRRFNLMRETVARFDVDGIELDFMRNGFFFARKKAREQAPLMTELIERLRRLLDEFGARGRKRLHLAVHVPVTQEVSLDCGLDTVGWIEAGLVDQVVADEGCVPFSVAPLDFIQAARKTGRCRVYSTADFGCAQPERPEPERGADSPGVPWTESQLRGWAAFQMAHGVDGLNIFNGHYLNGQEVMPPVFNAPNCWKNGFAGNKAFVAHNRSLLANMPGVAYPQTPSLPVTLKTGEPAQMEIAVTDDIASADRKRRLKAVTLRLNFLQLTVEDIIEITLNDQVVAKLGERGVAQKRLAENPSAPLSGALIERLVPLPAATIRQGNNKLTVRLVERNPRLKPPMVWKDAEIRLAY